MLSKTTEELEVEVGEQIRSLRLKHNIDQATLALRAGCSLSALKNLEYGRGSTLRTLVAVVRALNRADWLAHIAPTTTISPLNIQKGGHMRQRARSSTVKSSL